MSSILPFEIIGVIIDIVGENDDTDLLKKLSLVSHSFHQICSKHLFATVELSDVDRHDRVARSKKGFIKLVKSRPNVVKYIRELTYNIQIPSYPSTTFNNDDRILSSMLPNLLRTISHLNCLTITASQLDWNTLDSSLTSAFLYLMHLPTINHIDLSLIQNFPLSNFTSSPNLHRLDISYLRNFHQSIPEEEYSSAFVILSETTPKIREFHTSSSILMTTKLLHAKRQDGLPAFDFMDLRRLFICLGDEQNIRYLLQNAKSLEKLHLLVGPVHWHGLLRLRDIISSGARALKVLHFTVFASLLYGSLNLRLAGLCEGLELMAGHNMLEALSFDLHVDDQKETEDSIGSEVQRMEKVLVKSGWSTLRQVSFKIKLMRWGNSQNVELYKAVEQTLPDKYLNRLSKLESVALDYSVILS